MKKKFGKICEIAGASKFRQVRRALAKSRAQYCVLLKAQDFGEVVHLVRYWIKTDSVTIHRYSTDYYYDHFPGVGVFFRKGRSSSKRPPGYSRKWDNL